ncbi:hypothetical protein N9N67_07545 [Bacteriovoracaceae bacterium]|nr:hypothetical protein [Bacteriovoracaceae bacterium]
MLTFIFILFCTQNIHGNESDDYTYKGSENIQNSADQFNVLVNQHILEAENKSNNKTRLEKAVEYFSYSSEETKNLVSPATDQCTEDQEAEYIPNKNDGKTHLRNGYHLPRLPKKLKSFHEPKCDRERLMQKLKTTLNKNWPEIRNIMIADDSIDRGKINRREGSIYEDTAKGPLMTLGGCCDPIVNIDGIYVGIDKLDHILSTGHVYFEDYTKNFSTLSAMSIGLRRENGSWGLAGTGVKSYGDLAANYAGLHFWANLIDGEFPYIVCEDGKFKVNKSFDIRNFITKAMDESINCSSYNTENIAKKIDSKAQQVGLQKQCPVDPKECEKLKDYYTEAEFKYIVHKRCQVPEQAEGISLAEPGNKIEDKTFHTKGLFRQ